ncbi:uncharacterized protein FMAN_12967 [Fusarium mangiferae]|uniref:Uncharacterized protein n=1 Tax=Fusarium mangiferae TaxID=192010 RepID=A0A1L7U2L3_FUSMA|nr:uncharacterized protein FMAN_12967 [Fusarium mangiferae]CVL04954.1 uncharacterized protein FMAN_12967 [Fusarium mangiferae]
MSSLIVLTRNGGIVTGRCGRTINATVPIDFSNVMVNGDGARPSVLGNYIRGGPSLVPVTRGNFTVGNATYAIQPDPVFSGGPSCMTDVDSVNDRLSIYCTDLYWDYDDVIDETIESGCISDLPPARSGQKEGFHPKRPKIDPQLLLPISGGWIGAWVYSTRREPSLDGAGWPHQRYLYKQVSEVVQCGKNQSCTVTRDKGGTWTYGFVATGIAKFASFGFSVSKAITSGNGHCCHALPGERVCIWHKVAHTAYTVRMTKRRKFWPWDKYLHVFHGEQVNLVAPNHYNSGGGYVCRYNNECRSMAYEYWDCNGKRQTSELERNTGRRKRKRWVRRHGRTMNERERIMKRC